MADPGFGSAAIAELLRLVISETSKVVFLGKYFKDLQKMLEPLQPVVEQILRENGKMSEEVRHWMASLESALDKARALEKQCSGRHWNPWTRYSLSRELLQLMREFASLQQQSPLVGIAVSIQIQDSVEALKDEVKELQLALTTLAFIQSENCSKERATHEIRLTAAADVDSQSQGLVSQDEPVVELQPLPELVFGIDEIRQRLERILTQETTRKWVGVWGKGGSGKTLLAQLANNANLVQSHFEGQVFWLTVGRRPSIAKLHKTLYQRIKGHGHPRTFASDEEGMTTIYNLLLNKKVLVILDDVWERGVLEKLDVVSGGESKILVTTRNRDVLDSRGAADDIIVNMLSPEDSLKLFCAHAFPGEDPATALLVAAREDFAAEARACADECKGLPLALKVVGASLAGKRQRHEFALALAKLKDAVVLDEEQEKQLYHRLKLSYDELANHKSKGVQLQQCFLYFAAFAEDASIEVEQLLEYWIGEGLIKYAEDDEDPHFQAYYFLGELISRSLIEFDSGWSHANNMKFFNCKIHDVLRDLALYILQPRIEDDVSGLDSLFQAGKELSAWPARWSLPAMRAQRLSLMSNRLEVLPKLKMKAPNMKVLLINDNSVLRSITPGFLANFTGLQVLDLSRTGIKELPADFGKLRNLVVLKADYSALVSLPPSIGKLIKLQHLNIQNCGQLRDFPAHQLPKLVSLKYFNARGCAGIWDEREQPNSNLFSIAKHSTPRLDTLSSLTDLTRLWVSSSNLDQLPDSLSKLIKLRQLSIYFNRLQVFPDKLKSLTSLEILDLNVCASLQQLPEWIPSSLTKLQTIDLRGCTSFSSLPRFDELDFLTKLDLSLCSRLTKLPPSFGRTKAFPVLRELWLTGCSQLVEFPNLQPGAFPRLSLLNLVECAPTVLDDSFQVLIRLAKLDLKGCQLLQKIPQSSSFACLQCLEELKLSRTKVAQLPHTIAQLPLLKLLDLSGCNELEELPWPNERAPGLFPSLEKALFKGGGLASIPLSLAAAPKLATIDLTDCKRSVFQDELLTVLRERPIHIIGWDSS